MQHFNAENRYRIAHGLADDWASVSSHDSETFSELTRHGFHLVDMSGEVWILRRPVASP